MWCLLWVFLNIYLFHQLRKFSYTWLRVIGINECQVLSNTCSPSTEIIIWFSPLLCNCGELYLISHIEVTLHSWNKPNLGAIYYHFYILLTLISCFVKNVCLYVHERNSSIIFMSLNVILRFWYQGYTALIISWKIFPLVLLSEELL